MRVTVSARGRKRAIYIARELQRHGYLHRIITSYPVFETAKYGVERAKIKSLFVHEQRESGVRRQGVYKVSSMRSGWSPKHLIFTPRFIFQGRRTYSWAGVLCHFIP